MHRVLHDPPDAGRALRPAGHPDRAVSGQGPPGPADRRGGAAAAARPDTHPGADVPLQTVLRAGTDAAATQQLSRTLSTPPPPPVTPHAPTSAAADPWPTGAAADPWPTAGVAHPGRPHRPATRHRPCRAGSRRRRRHRGPPRRPPPRAAAADRPGHGPTGDGLVRPARTGGTPGTRATAACPRPDARTRPDGHGPTGQVVTAPARRDGFGRRLRREWADPWGSSTAIFLGALGGATGYVASTAVGTAAAVGSLTLVVVYGVRLLVAAALTPSAAPDGPPPQPAGQSVPAPRPTPDPPHEPLEEPMATGERPARPLLPYAVAVVAGLAVIAGGLPVRPADDRHGPGRLRTRWRSAPPPRRASWSPSSPTGTTPPTGASAAGARR